MFEIVHRMLSSFLIYSFYQDIMSLILKNTGLTLLSQENIRLMLIHPLSLFLLLAFLIFIAAMIFFEITALAIYCQHGWENKSINLYQLYKQTLQSTLHYLHLKNIPLLLLLAFFIVLSSFPFTSGFLKFAIPEFIKDAMLDNQYLAILYLSLLFLIHFLVFTFLFGLIFMPHSSSLKEAWQKSLTLIKKHPFRLLFRLLSFILLLQLSFTLIAYCIIALQALYIHLTLGFEPAAFRFSLTKLSGFFQLINEILIAVAMISFIIVESHHLNHEQRSIPANHKTALPKRFLRLVSGLLALALLIGLSESEIGGSYYYNKEKETQIIAHRGGALFAPENTVAALNNAIQEGAFSAEIDVQQTQDGTLIVMHDTNFKRTTGYDGQVWDTPYEIVKTLDAGSSYSDDANEPVPTLAMMLEAAKDRIHLMIELKSTGHEKQLEEATLALIKEYDMEDQCSIASMDSAILHRVKAINPKIETVLITALFYASLLNTETIDGFSVETTFVNYELTSLMDNAHKKIYAWTANEEANIKKLLRLGIDGLVTDNPTLARYCQEQLKQNWWIQSTTDFFFPKNDKNGS